MEQASNEKPKYMLLEKTKALYTMAMPYLNQFPKHERFTLRLRIEECIISCIRLLIVQNYQCNDISRKRLILDFLAEANVLSVLLQQAMVFNYISFDHHSSISSLLKEIIAIASSRYKNLGGTYENIQ